MTNFKTRLKRLSKDKGKIILANDYTGKAAKLESKTLNNLKILSKYLCAIKLNFHVLLPLGVDEIKKINKTAHQHDLQIIADIKLNDIPNTNKVTVETLWELGFDAVIVNPIMGKSSLKKLVLNSHRQNKGVITLCHMSSPEAKVSYELSINEKNKTQSLYQLFLKWAITNNVDGIIVGATFPKILQYCKKIAQNKLAIYSPGIGTQGGSVRDGMALGTDYFIVGRSIIGAKNPVKVAENLQRLTL